jgi:hypothetical protein
MNHKAHEERKEILPFASFAVRFSGELNMPFNATSSYENDQ